MPSERVHVLVCTNEAKANLPLPSEVKDDDAFHFFTSNEASDLKALPSEIERVAIHREVEEKTREHIIGLARLTKGKVIVRQVDSHSALAQFLDQVSKQKPAPPKPPEKQEPKPDRPPPKPPVETHRDAGPPKTILIFATHSEYIHKECKDTLSMNPKIGVRGIESWTVPIPKTAQHLVVFGKIDTNMLDRIRLIAQETKKRFHQVKNVQELHDLLAQLTGGSKPPDQGDQPPPTGGTNTMNRLEVITQHADFKTPFASQKDALMEAMAQAGLQTTERSLEVAFYNARKNAGVQGVRKTAATRTVRKTAPRPASSSASRRTATPKKSKRSNVKPKRRQVSRHANGAIDMDKFKEALEYVLEVAPKIIAEREEMEAKLEAAKTALQ